MSEIIIIEKHAVKLAGANGGVSDEHVVKMKHLDSARIVSGSNQANESKAVVVDTSAMFVRTPDGVVHRKDGVEYVPVVTSASYRVK
jgi:hypothetical protein